MMYGMEDYQTDAYVSETGLPAPMTHSIVVDLMEQNGTVIHQIVSLVLGENNAKATAEMLNRWRDQVTRKN